VIAVAPRLDDGTRFPTTFWLTCPLLVTEAHSLESSGTHLEWARRAQAEPELGAALLASAEAYRAARLAEGSGIDPCPDVGVAGQRDPLQVKCLHARVAAHLAGIPDPIGEAIVRAIGPRARTCDGACCAGAAVRPQR
jgi:hypothetical protein